MSSETGPDDEIGETGEDGAHRRYVCRTCTLDHGPLYSNEPSRHEFTDRDELGPVNRAFSFDEAEWMVRWIGAFFDESDDALPSFSVADVLNVAPSPGGRYVRPVWHLLEQLQLAGVIAPMDTTPMAPDELMEGRRFTRTSRWLQVAGSCGSPLFSLGAPYIAHRYGAVTVRIHVRRGDEVTITTGTVVGFERVFTSARAIRNADHVAVSWGNSWVTTADSCTTELVPAIDVAAIEAPRFFGFPRISLRTPRVGEAVVVLGYAAISGIAASPLACLNATIASEPYTSADDIREIVVSGHLPSGCIGSPMFGTDGRVVGMISREYAMSGSSGHGSTLYAAVPAREIRQALGTLPPPFLDSERYAGGPRDIFAM